MRVILLNMVLGSVSLLVVSAVCGIRLPEGCAVANRLPTRVFGICGRGPNSLWGGVHTSKRRKADSGKESVRSKGGGVLGRGTLNAGQKGNPEGSLSVQWASHGT